MLHHASTTQKALVLLLAIALSPVSTASLNAHKVYEAFDIPVLKSGWSEPANSTEPNRSLRTLSAHLPFYDHGNPTPFEQLMLEYINRARANPGAEAARLGIGLNDNIAPSNTIADTPKQPLAFHPNLIAAARGHSQWMLDNNVFSHTGVNGSSPGDRMESAGYVFSGSWTLGENIAWGGSTGPIDQTEETIARHDGLFRSPGHRLNLMGNAFNEIGVGILEGSFTHTNGTTYNALMATQKFARSGGTPERFLVGVVYYDFNGNGRYDIGEGISGIEVNVTDAAFYTRTASAGGYAIPVPTGSGNHTLSWTGSDLDQSSTLFFSSAENHKHDLALAYTAPSLSGNTTPPAGIPQSYTISPVPGATSMRIEGTRTSGGQSEAFSVTVAAGEDFSFTPLADSSYALRVQPLHHEQFWPIGPQFHITTTGSASIGYADWAAEAEQAAGLPAGTLADHPTADYSGDGISNLLAYALGLNALQNESTRFPLLQISSGDPFFEYTVNTVKSDVRVLPEISSDLTNWHRPEAPEAPSGFAVETIRTEGDTQTVHIHFPTTSAETQWFLRLIAEQI